MKNTISALALTAALALGGAAFAQPSGGPDAKGNAPLKHAHTVNDGSAKNGANSFTEGQAREHIEKSGFSAVSGLAKGDDGVWRGTAMKGGASMNVAMDFKGNVTTTGPAAGAMSATHVTHHTARHAAAMAAPAAAAAGADTAAMATPPATDMATSTTTTTTAMHHHGRRHHRMHRMHRRHRMHHGRHHHHHHGMGHAMRGGSDGGMVAASGVSSNDSGVSDKEQAARGQPAPQ